MNIAVGKKYQSRSGLVFEIVGKFAADDFRAYPYMGIARNDGGLILQSERFNLFGASCAAVVNSLLPNTVKHTRYVTWFKYAHATEMFSVMTQNKEVVIPGTAVFLRTDEVTFEEELK